MRILWIKVGGLWPLNTGGRLRSFHTLSEMSRRHEVTLLTTHGPADDPAGLRTELSRCAAVVSVPHAIPKLGSREFAWSLVGSWLSPLPLDLWKCRVPALEDEAARRLSAAAADVCVADFLAATPNLPPGGGVPVILFEHNVEHVIWKRLADVERRPARRALLGIEWRKMRRAEARACRRAALTVAVSEADRDALAALAPGARVCAIPTGVDTAFFTRNGTPEIPRSLVFTGSMDWYPNEDAAVHFAGEILPLIRQQAPDVSVTVVGRNPSPRLRAAMSEAGIVVTGTVDDVRPHVARASVCVVPLRVGGGTRLKIFEALAMEKAIVSTTVGAEGLPLVPGQHYLRADRPEDFAAAVVSLLRDPDRRGALGAAGRRLVEERYSWAQVAREFEARCEEAARRAG